MVFAAHCPPISRGKDSPRFSQVVSRAPWGAVELQIPRPGATDKKKPVVNVNGKLVEATSPQARSGIFAIFTRGRALAVGQARTWAQITVAW